MFLLNVCASAHVNVQINIQEETQENWKAIV